MKKTFLSLFILTYSFVNSIGQDSLLKPYQVDADAKLQISNAIKEAATSNKHVLIMIGGNWCKWCIRLTQFMASHESIDSTITADYVYIHVNYSKENKNTDIMEQLEYPQRFGFPVLVVVDQTGRRIHTQDTGILEQGEGYSVEKIKNFLLNWNVAALDPANYSK